MSEQEIKINKDWFDRLIDLRDKYQKEPNEYNLALLIGYIGSADFIIKNLGQIKI